MWIARLVPADAPRIAQFYRDAPDYWLMADGALDPDLKAQAFFSDTPPGCDPSQSHHLGLFLAGDRLPADHDRACAPPSARGAGQGAGGLPPESLRLSGVAELSFGFPGPADAYLGLMLLGPWARGQGLGARFLAHVEALARTQGAPQLCLAVLDANPRGRAFWERQDFARTGLRGQDKATGHWLERLAKPL
jgi:GNAT superfamily N-acetyltransferase